MLFALISQLAWGQITGVIQTGNNRLRVPRSFLVKAKERLAFLMVGLFQIFSLQDAELVVSSVGFLPKKIKLTPQRKNLGTIVLETDKSLDEVIITGNLKPVNRLESTIPVEVYSPAFLQQNPSPNLFEGIQFINGIRPQINCSVCNTGDIHINGLEGPYTFVLIDGMPIVSSLASVYGLNGIPNGMIEKVEIIKGPAGTLYGSQAVGG